MSRLAKAAKEELLYFVERLEEILQEYHIDTDDMIYITFYIQKMSPDEALDHVVHKILPWKQQIKDRNEDFFYKNKEIFGALPAEKVNYFSDLIRGTFSKDDKDEVWTFFDAFIAFAEEAKKRT